MDTGQWGQQSKFSASELQDARTRLVENQAERTPVGGEGHGGNSANSAKSEWPATSI